MPWVKSRTLLFCFLVWIYCRVLRCSLSYCFEAREIIFLWTLPIHASWFPITPAEQDCVTRTAQGVWTPKCVWRSHDRTNRTILLKTGFILRVNLICDSPDGYSKLSSCFLNCVCRLCICIACEAEFSKPLLERLSIWSAGVRTVISPGFVPLGHQGQSLFQCLKSQVNYVALDCTNTISMSAIGRLLCCRKC